MHSFFSIDNFNKVASKQLLLFFIAFQVENRCKIAMTISNTGQWVKNKTMSVESLTIILISDNRKFSLYGIIKQRIIYEI